MKKAKMAETIGAPPGTITYVGESKTECVGITLIEYTESEFQEGSIDDNAKLTSSKSEGVKWINIDGIHDIGLIERLGEVYGLHPLLLEDIVNTEQRPKVDDYTDRVLIVLKMLHYNDELQELEIEQVSLILGDGWVITLQEREGDVFDFVRDRIRNSKGRIRRMGADYLAYALIDAIVDNYFMVLEKIGLTLEDLEDKVIEDPRPETSAKIHRMKRETISLRHSIWPLREVISGIQRLGSKLIGEDTTYFLRDLYDHTIQVIDTVETYRDILSGMLDTYLSSISNRMNEVMKVLTIIATIFIPLTFIAGIYGMNFQYMPELGFRWGYFAVLGLMAFVGVVMLIFFKKKKWL